MVGSPSQLETTTVIERPPQPDLGRERWLTVQEVADRLHVSRDTVERWIHTSALRAANLGASRRLGRYRPSWRVPREALEEFLGSRFNVPVVPATRRHRRRDPAGTVIEFVK